MAATPIRVASAPCKLISGLSVTARPSGAHQSAGVAVDPPEKYTATECSELHSVATSLQKVVSLEQSRLYEGVEQGPGGSGEIAECESENGCVIATQQYIHSKSMVAAPISSASMLGQAIPPALVPLTSILPAPSAEVSPQADPTRSLERLTAPAIARSLPMPTVPAATAASPVGAPAGNGATIAAATDTSPLAIKRTEYIARATASGESLIPAAPGNIAASNAVGQDLHTRRSVNSVYDQCLRKAHRETCSAAAISTAERGGEVAVQLTPQNTLSCGSKNTRNRRGMNGDIPDIAYCRLKTRRAATTAGVVAAASTFSSSIPPMRVLPPDIAASRAPSPAAGNACPSPLPFAAASGPRTGDVLRAAFVGGVVAHSATSKTEDCSKIGRARSTHIPLQRYSQRQQHLQQIGELGLIQQFPLQAQRQLVQSRQAEKQQQLPQMGLLGQPSDVHQQDQKQQLEETFREQQLQGQQLYTKQQQQLQQQMQQQWRSQQFSQHKSIRLFLLEDYDGPELPSGYPLMSLAFGTSSEEEEEEQHQQHESANAARLFPPNAAAGETRLEISRLMRCAVLKKKKRERKVSVGATDALWQPHFHPHNQEFRVRYRYKGSMRLKTLSCARFGREGARRLTVAFVQRWQKSGRRIAAKTHRSKLALCDLPPDIHLLPVYDKKRRGASSVKRNDTTVSSYCSTSENNPSVPNCSGDTSVSKKICTSQDRCSSSNRIIRSIGDHCQNVGTPAAQVLPSPAAMTTPTAFSGLNRPVLPVFAIPQPLSLLEMLPSAAAAAACAPSIAFASAAGEMAPAATVPYIPAAAAAAALVSGRRGAPWSTASSGTGADTEHGKESNGVLLTQRTVPTEGNLCDNATTLSLEAGHVLSSRLQNKCDSSPLFPTNTTGSSETCSTSPATLFPHEGSSNTNSYSCGTQSTRARDSCHLLPIHDSCSKYCYPASGTGPLSSHSHTYNRESSAGILNFTVEKGIVDSALDSGAVAAYATTGAAAELTGALDEETSDAEAVCHTRPSAQGETSAGATSCLLPVHLLASPADTSHRPPSPASVWAFLAPPETLSTRHLPAVSTQLSPAAAASANSGAAASTTEAAPSTARVDACSSCPAVRATSAEPATFGAAPALRAFSKSFLV